MHKFLPLAVLLATHLSFINGSADNYTIKCTANNVTIYENSSCAWDVFKNREIKEVVCKCENGGICCREVSTNETFYITSEDKGFELCLSVKCKIKNSTGNFTIKCLDKQNTLCENSACHWKAPEFMKNGSTFACMTYKGKFHCIDDGLINAEAYPCSTMEKCGFSCGLLGAECNIKRINGGVNLLITPSPAINNLTGGASTVIPGNNDKLKNESSSITGLWGLLVLLVLVIPLCLCFHKKIRPLYQRPTHNAQDVGGNIASAPQPSGSPDQNIAASGNEGFPLLPSEKHEEESKEAEEGGEGEEDEGKGREEEREKERLLGATDQADGPQSDESTRIGIDVNKDTGDIPLRKRRSPRSSENIHMENCGSAPAPGN